MRSLSFRRYVATLSASVFLGVTLAACGGGASGPSAIPNDNAQPLSVGTGGDSQVTSSANAAGTAGLTSIHVNSSTSAAYKIVGKPKYHMYLTTMLHRGAAPATSARPFSVIYPGDLHYFGGLVLKTARLFNAFVDSSPSTFGTPNSFEEHLSYSNMIHITDPYVHATSGNRYDWAGDLAVNFPLFTDIGDNDLIAIVHAVAAAKGSGTSRIYNIFLPPGTNYCSNGAILPSGDCSASTTSPNPTFCAFHTAVVFSDIGEVLFTLEPFQDLHFCDENAVLGNPNGPTPNGIQNDSTYSSLSHELFETITDPEPGGGWFAPSSGNEIGDDCAYLPENTTLSGKLFRIQTEYENSKHACDNTP